LEYNTLKIAGSLAGFKHSLYTKERMRLSRLGKSVTEVTKLKLSANKQAYSIKVININTGDIKIFTSIRSTAKFMDMHHSYLAKCLKKHKFYIRKGYRIMLNK
jgi:hypothetical protein